jgi:YggT family protein
MGILANIIHLLFVSYTVMLFIRIVGSWFPSWMGHPFMRFVQHYTEPYLNFFRKIIPPIGGVLDISPILGFVCLGILERIIISLIL